jgi:hypothetical protein
MTAYEILGLPNTATRAQIKVAYRQLVKQYHPDRNPDIDSNAQIQLINEAYDILSDPVKRSEYDWELYARTEDPGAPDPVEAYREEFLRRKAVQRKREQEEMQQWRIDFHRKSRFFVLAMCIIPLSILLDYHLPWTPLVESATDGWQKVIRTKSGTAIKSYMVTPSGIIRVAHFLHIDYDYSTHPPINFSITPIFKMRVSASLASENGYVVYPMYIGIYATGLTMPYILLAINLLYFVNYRYAYWKLTLIFAPFLALLIFVAFVLQ